MVLHAESENSHWVKMSPLWRPLPYVQSPCSFPGPESGLVLSD